MTDYIITGKAVERWDLPTAIMAQEIVRCRDCKWYEFWEFRDGRKATDCARGGEYIFDTEPDGFCAWGERK